MLEEIADALGDAQMSLAAVIELGGGLEDAARRARVAMVSRRLRRLAERLEPGQSKKDQERPMRPPQLVEELLQVADNAELLIPEVAETDNLPLPLRAGLSDRLLQLVSLLRLSAKEIERPLGADKTFNLPVDA
jgi:hypothetical protein